MSEQLLLKPAEAAKALAISERMLRYLTSDGEISCLRVGRSVRYDPMDLRAWIERQKKQISLASRREEC